jgi:hypothetical protein
MRNYRTSRVTKINMSLLHQFHHLGLFMLPQLKQRLEATTSSSAEVQASGFEEEINTNSGGTSHIQKAHPPQEIIGNLNERVTRFSRSAHLSCFTNTLFVALFEP